MTARTTDGFVREKMVRYLSVVLATGVTVYNGSLIYWDPVADKATNVAAPGLKFLGFYGSITPGANPVGKFVGDGTTKIQIDLGQDVLLHYFANGTGGDAVTTADIFESAYGLDDATVSRLAVGKSLVGTIWDVDTRYGIGILKTGLQTGNVSLAQLPALAAFVAGALAPAVLVNGALYDVPTTAAASVITLPAAQPDGTIVYFAADGTKNGNTVQYADATGPVNLTTALIASKRHLVVAAKANNIWRANAYVGP